MQASSRLPPFANHDYPLDLTLRIVPNGAAYEVDIIAQGQCVRRPIAMSEHDLRALNREMQHQVEALALDVAMGTTALRAAMRLGPLAELGNYAFRKVFGGGGTADVMRKVLGRTSSLQVVSEDFFLPWELLYPDLEPPLSYDGFLGLNRVVGRAVLRPTRHEDFLEPAIPCGDQPRLGLLTYGGLPGVLAREVPFFDQLAREGRIILCRLQALDAGRKPDEIKHFCHFWKEPLAVAHLACEAIYDEAFHPRSHLLLSDEFPVSLQDMEIYDLVIDSHPLVILNGCRTGRCHPLSTSHFAGAFLQCGARGVVATECHVPDDFAADFAERLYCHLLDGRPLGESLLAARQFFLTEHGDPSGLLYSMYASPEIRLAR